MSKAILNCSLLPYQSDAVDWCVAHENVCAILAYDMGLGKTVIACSLIVAKPVQTLVMLPTSLIYQWKNELEQHTSGLNIAIYHGSNRKYKSSREAAQNADVILTTSAIIANDIKNSTFLFKKAKRWIIDEAHKLRNSKSKTYTHLSLYAPSVENKVFLTGTPICNSPDDLISLVCLSNLPFYNDLQQWKGICSPAKCRMLEGIIDKILLRRTKAQTISHILPSISFQTIELQVESDRQKDTYNQFIDDELMLRKILRMRQSVNNHIEFIDEDAEISEVSVKLQAVLKIIESIPKGEKIIIVSYFNKLLQDLQGLLVTANTKMYHGGLTLSERNDVIFQFKNDSNASILLMNLRAGGCGLNLVQANHLILMEPYWNDAEEQQAINRVYRIGQTRPVSIYKLFVKDSIESWLLRLQKYKDDIAYLLIGKESESENIDMNVEKKKVRQLFKFVKDMRMDDKCHKDLEKFIDSNESESL